GCITCSCNARSNLTCTSYDRLPISSRNNVPPVASSNWPVLSFSAPVNDPFTWPKSSLDASSLDNVPQSIETNGLPARLLFWWIARATYSFPVPLSPRISTDISVGATNAIYSCSLRAAVLDPSTNSSPGVISEPALRLFEAVVVLSTDFPSNASLTTISNSSGLTGLVM